MFAGAPVKVTVYPARQDEGVVGIEEVDVTPDFVTLRTSAAAGRGVSRGLF